MTTTPASDALLNSDLIAQRRRELQLSDQQFAQLLGVSVAVLRCLHAGTNHDVLNLGFVKKIADILGISLHDLIAERAINPATDEPGGDKRDDHVLLQAALAELGRTTPADAIAQGLGWRLARVRAAVSRLRAELDGTGLIVHHGSRGGYALHPRTGILSAAQLERLHCAQSAHSGLRHSDNRVLHDVMSAGPSGTTLASKGAAYKISIDRLCKLGVVEQHGRRYRLSESGATGLMIDDFR